VGLVLPENASIANIWNGLSSANRGTISVANQSYNGSVTGGQSANFGFQGTGSPAGLSVTGCSAA
jgi:hypothetical protein